MAPLGRPGPLIAPSSSASDAPSLGEVWHSLADTGLALSDATLVRQIRDDTRSCNGTAGGIRCCAWPHALSTSRERTAFNAARLGRIGAPRRRLVFYQLAVTSRGKRRLDSGRKSNGKINESHGNATTNALPALARLLQCFLTSQDLRLLRCATPATAHLTPVDSDSLLVRVCCSASGNEAAKQLIRSWAPQTTAIATGVVLINNPENMRRFVRARILLEEANTGCIASFDDSLSVVRALHASRRRTPSPSSRAAPAHDYPTLTCGSLHRAGDLSLLSLGTPTAAAAVAGRGGPDADPR